MAHQRVSGKNVRPPNLKGIVLGVFAVSMLPTAVLALIQGKLLDLMVASAVFILLIVAAMLTRKGLAQTKEYQGRYLATAPKPLRLLGLITSSAAAGLIAMGLNHHGLLITLCYVLLAALGYYLVYGLDPRREKISQRLGGYSTEELVETLREAEEKILKIDQHRQAIGNPALAQQLERIVKVSKDVLETLEKNPRQLRQARKFINVYLDGAQQVVTGYANMHDKVDSEVLHKNFSDVLATIEESFKEHRRKLLANDMLDLDVQIEVLKKQLEEEGMRI